MAVYQADGAYYRKHMDGGYGASVDNGRKITALYYPNPTDWQVRREGRRGKKDGKESLTRRTARAGHASVDC